MDYSKPINQWYNNQEGKSGASGIDTEKMWGDLKSNNIPQIKRFRLNEEYFYPSDTKETLQRVIYTQWRSNNPDQGQEIVDNAMQFIGVHYLWGGKTPAGFDCSGFTEYVYMLTTGVEIGSSTWEQINSGIEVNITDLKQGDLIFYNDLSHVAIYIGGDQIIHSSGDIGRPLPGVSITSVSWYQGASIYGVRRIIK